MKHKIFWALCFLFFGLTLMVNIYAASIQHKRFTFVLFYMRSCLHCQVFDPILAKFSQMHKITVLAYTLDGGVLPSFPNTVYPTQSELLKYFPNQNPVVPTLFLMDNQKQRIYLMLQGAATFSQLSDRFSLLKNKIAQQVISQNQSQRLNFHYE